MSKKKRKDKKPFAARQPKDGDTVLHCGHIKQDGSGHAHFSASKEPMPFLRPDGTMGRAAWIVECDACFRARNGTNAFMIRGDAIWNGNAPIVQLNPEIPEGTPSVANLIDPENN